MRVTPFSYLQTQGTLVEIPSGSNIVMRFEDVNTNFSGGVWADIASSPVAQIVTGSTLADTVTLSGNGLELDKYSRSN